MDPNKAFQELSRAVDQFDEIVLLHIAARRSIILAATLPDAETRLQVQISTNERLKHRVGDDTLEDAEASLMTARREFEDDFVRLRRSTLVSMCSAFEYVVKATYVDQASSDPVEAGRRLEGVNVKLRASEVVGLDATERWYLVADRLFDHLGEASNIRLRGFGERARRLLTEFVPSDKARTKGIEEAFHGETLARLNEAFLVRNCFVHNGGRVNNALASEAGKVRGEMLVLDRKYGTGLMRAIISMNGQLQALRL
jgi:hypothetical protein